MSRRPQGFTVIELLVVIVVIGVLVGLLLPALTMLRKSSRKTATVRLMNDVGTAVQTYLQTWPLLGDDTASVAGDWDSRPLLYLVRRPVQAPGGRAYLELPLAQLAKGTGPYQPADHNDCEHLLDFFPAHGQNRIQWTVVNVRPTGAARYRYSESIEMRSTAGTPKNPSDDLILRWSRANGRWDLVKP